MLSPGRKLTVKLTLVAGLIAGISFFLHFHSPERAMEHVLFRELYFLPIILAAFWFGLKGGLAASLTVSLLFLPVVLQDQPQLPGRQMADLLEMALYNVVALLLGLMRDRQLRQQAQMQRAKALAAMGQAVASVAHDMKTPLMAIGGFTAQVRRQLDPGDPAVHKLDVVISQTARLESLVRDMLDFARPLELHPAPVDLAGLAAECLELTAPLASLHEVDLRLEDRQPPGAQRLDPYRVQQALLNLLSNAVQASPPGSLVILRLLARSPRELCLEVLDQGRGVAPEHRQHILTPFFTTKKEGTGLGLPLARKVAEAHGGRLEVADNQPQGMVFRLVLPAARPPSA
jgi:two-component system, NtrC family, sensor histidine kinase HydH